MPRERTEFRPFVHTDLAPIQCLALGMGYLKTSVYRKRRKTIYGKCLNSVQNELTNRSGFGMFCLWVIPRSHAYDTLLNGMHGNDTKNWKLTKFLCGFPKEFQKIQQFNSTVWTIRQNHANNSQAIGGCDKHESQFVTKEQLEISQRRSSVNSLEY